MNFESDHEKGNKECPECWDDECKKCQYCERGLVHTEFGDENYDGDYWLLYECDECGELGEQI